MYINVGKILIHIKVIFKKKLSKASFGIRTEFIPCLRISFIDSAEDIKLKHIFMLFGVLNHEKKKKYLFPERASGSPTYPISSKMQHMLTT